MFKQIAMVTIVFSFSVMACFLLAKDTVLRLMLGQLANQIVPISTNLDQGIKNEETESSLPNNNLNQKDDDSNANFFNSPVYQMT